MSDKPVEVRSFPVVNHRPPGHFAIATMPVSELADGQSRHIAFSVGDHELEGVLAAIAKVLRGLA